MIRVLVAGAAGRMGSEVVRAVSDADGMEVVAAVDPGVAGCLIPRADGEHIECLGSLADAIAATKPDVMVDFTHPTVVEGNLRTALPLGVDCVVGTTGLSEEKLAELAELAPDGTALFFAPNFAIGAVLMMQFAELAARHMPYVEVTEFHHDKKADAPSGTAIRTARMIAAARGEAPIVPGRETELPGMEGARGALVDGVSVHSVRLPGPRCAPGSALRRPRPDAHHPPRLDRPDELHARRGARSARGRLPQRADRGPREADGGVAGDREQLHQPQAHRRHEVRRHVRRR